MIYADILKTSLKTLEPDDVVGRRNLYQQLTAGLKSSLDARNPPVDWQQKVLELRLLRSTIQRFEGDLRSGIDVTADDYVPEGLEEEQARLDAMRAISEKQRPVPAMVDEDQTAFTAALSLQMRQLSLAAAAEGFREKPLRLMTLGAVMSRLLIDILDARGFVGLMWILWEPMLLIGTVVCGYLMLNERFVMGMDVIPFSIVGVVAWLLFRVTVIRVSAVPMMTKEILALPPIRVVSTLCGQALVRFFIYSVSLVLLLGFAMMAGHGVGPENWVLFSAYWILFWFCGIACGVIMAPILSRWHAFGRATLIGIRFVGWTSGLVYVTEQFPDDLKYYVLWNPLCHGTELLRSAYFIEYQTEDASLFYFMFSLGIMILMAAYGTRVLYPRVEPA